MATTADVLADFRTVSKRTPMYSAADKAPRAACPAISDVAYVTRGTHKNGGPVLLVQDGSQQTAIALAAVGEALAGGVISTSEVLALLGVAAEHSPAITKAIKEARG